MPIFPATCTGNPRGFQNVADQRSGRGLAVRAGDAIEAPAQEPPGQFDFAPHGNPMRARGGQRRHHRRHAGARHDQILLAESFGAVAAEFERDARGAQLRRAFPRFPPRAALFGGGDARAARRAEQRRGDARARQPHHQHAFAREFDARLQRVTSISASSAKTAQKPTPRSRTAR